MPPRKAAQVQGKESAAPATSTTTRGRATAAARATRSSPASPAKKTTPVAASKPGPMSRKKGGAAASPSSPAPSPEKKKKDESVAPPTPSPIIKQSPTKQIVEAKIKAQEAAEEKSRKQKPQLKNAHDDSSSSSGSESDGDDDKKSMPLPVSLNATPQKKQPVKSKKKGSPPPKTTSKPRDVSISGDDDHDHDHEDGDTEPEPSNKHVKAKDPAFNEGMNVFALMDSKEIEELLDRIDRQCSITDNYSVKKRENLIDWDQVAFSSYGGRQCKVAWTYLKHHSRSYRIMSEVVSEVKSKFLNDRGFQTKLIESLPGFPQKPPNSMGGFYCFNREQWDKKKDEVAHTEQDLPNFVKFQRECRVKFEALPQHLKQKYEQQAELAMAEYKRQVKQFYAENPGLAEFISKLHAGERQASHAKKAKVRKQRQRNPSGSSRRSVKLEDWTDPYEDAPQPPTSPAVTFMQAKLNLIEPPPTQEDLPELKQGIFEKWKSFSDRKRAKWIGYCVEQCVAYLESSREYQEAHPGYIIPPLKVKRLLNAEDIAIWETANGKPSNHFQTSFDMFLDEFLRSEENEELPEDQRRAIAQTKWNEMQWFEKEMFTMRFKVSQLEHRNNLQKFYAKVPPFLKEICLKKIPKKFWKLLEDVDKVPIKSEPVVAPSKPASELLITAEGGVVYKDDESRKQKKANKRKREKAEEEEADVDVVNEVYEDNFVEDSEFSQGYVEEEHDVDPIPKKKKKKKKRAEHEDESEQNYSNYQHKEEEDYPLQGGEYSKATEKAKKIAKLHTEEMMRAGDAVAVTLDSEFVETHKHSSKYFPENNSITKNDIYESIRGIFDARALGRKFSIYYYYAKYVASEKMWIDSVKSSGLAKTAINIIQTFLSLPGVQQEIFIQQSYSYHEAKRHPKDFPNEPKQPIQFAKNLYQKQVTDRKRRDPTFVAPKWTELPDVGQLYYTKLLYHETKLYMRRYDAFISSLTPSDFVDYAIHKYKNWEVNLYTKQSISRAFRGFIFPLAPSQEIIKGEGIRGVDGDLNLIGTTLPYTSGQARNLQNPFLTNKAVDAKLEKIKSTKKSPDSDNKAVEYSLLLDKDEIFRRKVKKAEMYEYPLDDIIRTTTTLEPDFRDTRIKWISEGTQTAMLDFVSVSTQTVNDCIINIIN